MFQARLSRLAPRQPGILLVVLVAMMLGVASAQADGDPASDVLLIRNVFFLYNPPPASAIQQTLNAEVTRAGRAGLPFKVALIRAPLDLGLVGVLFGHPQRYADFLGQEISNRYAGALLVVMPNGYGVHRVDAAARRAIARLPKPASGQIDDLARAAVTAVSAIASASGHPIATPDTSTTRTGGSSTPVVAIIVGIVVLTAAAALLISRRRAQTRRSSQT